METPRSPAVDPRLLPGFLTVEADGSDVAEEGPSLHRIHAAADPGPARTQILLHVVQSVSHGVNRIDHKLDFTLLFVRRAPADPLVTCRDQNHCIMVLPDPPQYPVQPGVKYLCISFCQGPV